MLKILFQIARKGISTEPSPPVEKEFNEVHRALYDVLGRALAIRQIDAGSCNGCELEIHALNNPYYNIEGLGIKFVASPRHADLLLVTGPVSCNMAEALRRTIEATPCPRLVVAVGDCGCNGGIFGKGYACLGGVSNVVSVDAEIHGCPPTPIELLRGILEAVRGRKKILPPPIFQKWGKIKEKRKSPL